MRILFSSILHSAEADGASRSCLSLVSAPHLGHRDFVREVLGPGLESLRGVTRVLAIFGNDDPRFAGPGMALTVLDEDTLKDSVDCEAAFTAGRIALK